MVFAASNFERSHPPTGHSNRNCYRQTYTISKHSFSPFHPQLGLESWCELHSLNRMLIVLHAGYQFCATLVMFMIREEMQHHSNRNLTTVNAVSLLRTGQPLKEQFQNADPLGSVASSYHCSCCWRVPVNDSWAQCSWLMKMSSFAKLRWMEFWSFGQSYEQLRWVHVEMWILQSGFIEDPDLLPRLSTALLTMFYKKYWYACKGSKWHS